MKYKINDKQDGIDIHIENSDAQKKELLDALQDCQQGQCSCPTDEYDKLDSLAIEETEAGTELHLKAKQGEHLDKDEIERCLSFTQAQLEK